MTSIKRKRLATQQEVREAARKFLGERGLDLRDGDYLPATSADADNLKLPSSNGAAGIVIWYHDVKGAKVDFCRFRYLEQPKESGWDKLTARQRSERRYTQPAGVPPRAYFPKNYKFVDFFAKPAHDQALVITEGEFKADAAAKHGIPCVALGGVWNFREKETASLIPDLARLSWAGMAVHICFDSDVATNTDVLRARDDLAERLEALGARLSICSLPQLERGQKTGLDDFLKQKGKKAFLNLPLERWYGPNVPRLEVRTKDDFLRHEYAEREEILRSQAACLLRHPSIMQIHAYRGVGKTHVATLLAGALARKDGEFFRWKTKRPLRVLYVDGEQVGKDGQQVVGLQAADAPSDNFHYLTLEDQPTFRIPKIVTREGRKALERVIEENRIEVLILDSLSTLANVSMNEEENQLALGDWFVRLRTGLRVTVIYLHHDGKEGKQRGHSKHEDWIDLSIHLTWSPDYHGAEGLRAHFHIDKARQPVADGQTMRITFGSCGSRKSEWRWETVTKEQEKDGDMVEFVAQLLFRDPKMSQNDLEKAVRAQGGRAKNEKLRKIIARGRQLRAQSDAVLAAEAKGKPPKY